MVVGTSREGTAVVGKVAVNKDASTTSLGSRRSRPSTRGERAKSRAVALRNTLVIVVVGVFVTAAVTFAVLFLNNASKDGGADDYSGVTEVEESVQEPEEPAGPVLPERIDFQPVVDAWVASVGGNRSVLIYDLDRGEVVGAYNTAEDYGTASLYKLFVVYEGYTRVENGEWDGEAKAGSTGYTINKCLDLAIRESYSPCAETLWAMLGHDALDTIIETKYGITGSDISRLVSNVGDITKMMQRFYEHPDFKDEARLNAMWDSFLNQPETTYEWRQGLPSGFSRARVYNKVGGAYNVAGRYWDIYHDAAIVNFPEGEVSGLSPEGGRNFIVVVMTNKVDYPDIARFGKMIEEKYYAGN